MKILFVTNAFLPESRGGTELHAFHLARALGDRHEVRVFVRGGRGDIDDYVVDRFVVGGIEVVRVNYNFKDAASFRFIWQNRRIDEIFRAELAGFLPDLVHIHHLTCLSTGIIDVAKDVGLPCVMTLHDFWMFCPRGQRIDPDLEICETIDRAKCRTCLSKLWPHFFPSEDGIFSSLRRAFGAELPADLFEWDENSRRVLGRVDRLISPSEFHRRKLLEFGLSEDRLATLTHGLEVDRLLARRDPDLPMKTIGFIGTVIPSKGVHVLIDAFKKLGDPGLSLEIWGNAPGYHGDGGYLERLQAAAMGTPGIKFWGSYDNEKIGDILAKIDCLVVPSIWWETYCLTIFEGLLSGTVVCASDHGAMREALRDGREGLLFAPGNADDLAEKLRSVRDDVEVRRRFRSRGSWIKSTETHAREMLDVYRTALAACGKNADLAHQGPLPAAKSTIPPANASAHPPVAATGASWREGKSGGPAVTVFIPTWNGGKLFDEVLRMVHAQKTDFEYEVFCIDSGSRDETVDIIKKWKCRLVQIPNSEFNHGLTRNRAVSEAKGEIVALLTQDAVPWNELWLANLVANFDDPKVAGAYCHQLPRADCNPFQIDRLRGWTYGDAAPIKKSIASRAEYEALSPMEKYKLIAFDDVASAVRKSVMRHIPFERRQFGEDVAWAKQAILAGWKIVMDPRAVVVHSHNNPIWYEFKRVYLDHQNLHDLVGMHLVPRFFDALMFTISGTRHLAGVIRAAKLGKFEEWKWLLKTPFYSLGQNMGQYLGAKSLITKKRGLYGFIDKKLKKGV